MIFTGQVIFYAPAARAFMQTHRRAKSLISSGNHIVVYFVRRGIVRD